MSAIVCGKRSSFFEDIPSSSSSSSPPVSKRIRCPPPPSPVRLSPPRTTAFFGLFPSSSRTLAIDHLQELFRGMDRQLFEKALDNCHGDIDSAIRSLSELRLESAENLGFPAGKANSIEEGEQASTVEALTAGTSLATKNHPVTGSELVEYFVGEMISASNFDDARNRASRALELLEKSISENTASKAQFLFQENVLLKGQLQGLIQENALLKRAVAIQHDRQKEYEDRTQELENLKQTISQYQEQLRTLELNNYSLTVHLKRAQQSSSIPGRFHPDVF